MKTPTNPPFPLLLSPIPTTEGEPLRGFLQTPVSATVSHLSSQVQLLSLLKMRGQLTLGERLALCRMHVIADSSDQVLVQV